MNSIYNYNLENLTSYLAKLNEAPFKAKQIFKWLYQKKTLDFSLMNDLSKDLRLKLENEFNLSLLTIEKENIASDNTRKFLFRLADNSLIETVLIKHSYGNSLCVTTEVGCAMGCAFCASGLFKKKRNLTLGELILQVLTVAITTNEEINSIVIMGTGEPFTNYENVIEFIKMVNANYGFNIGARKITVSTCGIVPRIKDFAELDLQINLAISLHAPNNELRNRLMPINNQFPLEELFKALDYYYLKTKRRITIEYIMLHNLNTTKKCLTELINLTKARNVYINLIPYNPVDELSFNPATKEEINNFYDGLKKAGIDTTMRFSRGVNANAACGQLRAKVIKNESHRN